MVSGFINLSKAGLRIKRLFSLVIFFSASSLVLAQPVAALSPAQKQVINEGIYWYNVQSDSCAAGGITLSGSDNIEKSWNFFVGQGLSNAQTAGVLGNIQQESHFDPTLMQRGGDSQNPDDAGSQNGSSGWGLVQWDPGTKVNDLASANNITGPIYELSTQLQLVWAEMSGTSPTGVKNMVAGLKNITDAQQAATYFNTKFEGGTDPGGVRGNNAIKFLQRYGNGDAGNSGTPADNSGGCLTSNGVSPDCQNVQGTAQILCQAEKYKGLPYEESVYGGHQGGAAWHQACSPLSPSTPGCVLDCSGIVNIAVYDIYHVDLRENTYSEVSDVGKYWQRISASEAQAGDIFQPNPGHVEIVDHIAGGTIYAFGAHHPGSPAGPDHFYKVTPSMVFLRYIGPGA